MHHKIILFDATCPGAGKSTLSNFLSQNFSRREIAHDWVRQDDVRLETASCRLMEALQNDSPNRIDALLYLTSNLISQIKQPDRICVLDEALPGYHWLIGHHSMDDIAAYTASLYELMRSMNPLIVYLRCEPSVAWRRAIDRSGEDWLNQLTQRLEKWRFTFHPKKTEANLEQNIAFEFFRRKDEMSRMMLARNWTGATLYVDTTHSFEQAQTELVRYFTELS